MIQAHSDEILAFLKEDIGSGDITASILADSQQAQATVITRDNMVLCGQAWFDAVF
ncbi:MAG: nicotinate-nucleotide diphosphorylase, partial [Methylococcales bacterium]